MARSCDCRPASDLNSTCQIEASRALVWSQMGLGLYQKSKTKTAKLGFYQHGSGQHCPRFALYGIGTAAQRCAVLWHTCSMRDETNASLPARKSCVNIESSSCCGAARKLNSAQAHLLLSRPSRLAGLDSVRLQFPEFYRYVTVDMGVTKEWQRPVIAT
jgi:hypothetical protein